MKKFNYYLCALQLLAIASVIVSITALILLFHHQTDDYSVPFLKYLASIRLAVPPIIALFVSYILVFVSGIKIGDAPRVVISYLRNSFFQSPRAMLIVMLCLFTMSLSIFWYTSVVTPPSYARLIAVLLGGEQDRQVLVKNELKLLEEKNPDLARKFRLAVDVFQERSKRNFNHGNLNTTTPRLFVRALDTNISDKEWAEHPLRKLALAESYSMWAQAALSSPLQKNADPHWREWLQKCLELNEEVANSSSRYATPLMQYSAINNSGNALLYTGDLKGAEQYYKTVLNLNRNLSSAGNLIAVYIYLGELDSAIEFAKEIREWGMNTGKALTETSAFSAVLGNSAFAYLMRDEYENASQLFIEAYDLEPDNMNKLNLALSLILEGDRKRALYVLSQFKYPDLELADQSKRVMEEYDTCYYFVRALVIEKTKYPLIAANFYTYLKQARTSNQLLKENAITNNELRLTTLNALQNDPTPCRDFYMVPAVRRLLGE